MQCARLDDEAVEKDVEVASAKLRYEIQRQEEAKLMVEVIHEKLNEKKINPSERENNLELSWTMLSLNLS